jgi:hypothetical protein
MGEIRIGLIVIFLAMTVISFWALLRHMRGAFWAFIFSGFLTVVMFFSERILEFRAKIPGGEFSTSLINTKSDTIVMSKNTLLQTSKVYDTLPIAIHDKGKRRDLSSIQVTGNNAIVSQNQSGGIAGPVTLNSPNIRINEASVPEWTLGPSERVNDTLWGTKLTVQEKGTLAFYNWNILLTLSTPIIRRQEIQCTVGPWMPLSLAGKIRPNQFFIGFSEFRPGQGFSDYLYSRDSLTVMRKETISTR